MNTIFQAVYLWAYLAVAVSLLAVLVNRSREKRTVGEIHVEARDWGFLRIAGMGGLAAGMLLAWFGRDVVPAEWSFPLLLLVAFIQVYRPDFGDRVCGADGVRFGWYVRHVSDLESWRLTGDHLRFELFGLWRAVPLPKPLHEGYRARLEALIPERESAFKD